MSHWEKTRPAMWKDELPEPFVCVVCQRESRPDPWHWQTQFKPPICRYCSIHGGHQVRIPGMTRGDHHTLQRLVAITDALRGAAGWEEYRVRFGSI